PLRMAPRSGSPPWASCPAILARTAPSSSYRRSGSSSFCIHPTRCKRGIPVQLRPQLRLTRRRALRLAALGAATSSLSLLDAPAWRPRRVAAAVPDSLPAIQFDVADFIPPAQAIDG